MTPWDYQKELRRSAKWIYLRAKHEPDLFKVDFIPWVLTPDNSQDTFVAEGIERPKYSYKMARKVIADLEEMDLLEERTIGNGVRWFVVNADSWKPFYDSENRFDIYILPSFHAAKSNILITTIFAIVVFAMASFFGSIFGKLGEGICDHFLPQEIHSGNEDPKKKK